VRLGHQPALDGVRRERLGYRPALDGVRAIAILPVILVHYYSWPRAGWLGVEVFFVLSGFLITTLLLEEHRQTGTVDLRAFFIRRARRLLPALFAMLLAYLLITAIAAATLRSPAPLRFGLIQVAIGVSYVGNFISAWIPGSVHLGHLWSLALEEQFYVVWPPVLIVLLRRRVRGSRLFMGLIVAAAGIWALRVGLWLGGAGLRHLGGTPEVSADSLLIGCAAGVAYVHGLRPAAWARQLGTPALVVAVAYLLFGPNRLAVDVGWSGWPLWKTPFAVVVAVAVIAAVSGSRVLSLPPLVFTGRISYGLYLWHLPIVFVIPKPLVALPLTFAVATSSYYLLERRFLHRARVRRRARGELAPGPAPA
jgi:peptidoglycan/LPS O-acetylase OafA/YrhL